VLVFELFLEESGTHTVRKAQTIVSAFASIGGLSRVYFPLMAVVARILTKDMHLSKRIVRLA
jgi:hypothetical protein